MMTNTVWISCNTCGADAFQELSTIDEWHVGQCSECEQIYVNPMPFFEPSTDFSEISMDFQYTRFQHEITDQVLRHDKRQFSHHIEEMTLFSGKNVQPGNFLDIGCGSGSSVRAAEELGWNAVGVDIDTKLVELGREKLGVDLRNTPLLKSGFEENHFDFIRLRDVIEHLPDPYETLIEIQRILAPGGFVLVATPNEDALPTQARLFLGVKRATVATVAPPHHVHGFTPKTLRRIFERVGLSVMEIKTTTPVDPLYVTARNMLSSSNKIYVLVWYTAKAMGKGSMLIGWVRADKD